MLVSMRRDQQEAAVGAIRQLAEAGFRVIATTGTADTFEKEGIEVVRVNKAHQASPNTVESIESGEVDMVINTVDADPQAISDSYSLRRAALQRGIPYCTTLAAARASSDAIRALAQESIGVRALQEIHAKL